MLVRGCTALRVSLADDHPVVLEGLVAILLRHDGLQVVARDLNGTAALESIRAQVPDIAVLDAAMPGMAGVEVLRAVRELGLPTRVVLLAAELGSDDLMEAIRLGVDGILIKDEAATVLLACIDSMANGARWVSVNLLERALNIAARNDDGGQSLTSREAEVAEKVSQGLQNKEIAGELGIADGTVRIHVHNIFKKFGIQNRVELANRLRRKDSASSS